MNVSSFNSGLNSPVMNTSTFNSTSSSPLMSTSTFSGNSSGQVNNSSSFNAGSGGQFKPPTSADSSAQILPPPPPYPVVSNSGSSNPTASDSLPKNAFIVLLDRGNDGLGFSIVGGFGSNLGDLPIYVKTVFDKGSAAREGTLKRGDEILSVNEKNLMGMKHAEAVKTLTDAKGIVKLVILPSK